MRGLDLLKQIALALAGGGPDPKGSSPRSPQWQAVRDAFVKAQPYCSACGGREKLEVHHIVPFHVDPSLELNVRNLIVLCERPGHNCHLTWGHFYSWASWNCNVVADATAWLERVRNRPASHVES